MSGPAILSLYVLSGACVYAAVGHLLGAFRREFNRPRLIFSGICLFLAVFGVSHVLAYQAMNVSEYVAAMRWNVGAVLLLFMLLPWFIGSYTGIRPRWFLLGSSGVIALLFVLNLFQPHSIQYAEMPGLMRLTLPWGETVTRSTGGTGVLFLVGAFMVIANLAFGLYALARTWVRDRRWTTLSMLIGMALSLAATFEGMVVRMGFLEFIHVGPYAFALMVLVLSLALEQYTQAEVLDSERRFRWLVEQSPVSIQVLSPDGRAISANSAWEQLWGTPKDTMRNYNILKDQQLAEQGVMPYLEQALAGQATKIPPVLYDASLNPHVKNAGRARWVRAHAYPIKNEAGEVVQVILMHEDVTTKKYVDDAIRLIASGVSADTGEKFFQSLVRSLAALFNADHAFIGLLRTGGQERITTLAVCENGEVTDEPISYDLAGTPCENVTGKKTCAYPSNVQDQFPDDELLVEMGAESYIGTPLFDSQGDPLGLIAVLDRKPLENVEQVGEILEIFAARASAEVQRLNAESHIRRMAYEDYLTGLASRANLHERLAKTVRELRSSGRSGALTLIDLDHFKTINDALGHDVGDEVLRAVARRLTDAVDGGALLARVGGDEFVALVEESFDNERDAESHGLELAERILRNLTSPVFVGDRAFNVGASIGVTTLPHESRSALDIMRHADMALYHAKSLGRGRIQLYEPSLLAAVTNRLHLEEGLRAALESNELELYFQPQVDDRGRMVGAEALLRWHHPDLGEVAPEQFIPVAEETGLIHQLGAWVIDQVCLHLEKWLRDDAPFQGRLSFNASTWQFTSSEFVDEIRRVLHERGIDARHLVLELTESALLYDIDETIDKLNRLRKLGFKIALDDFGTGYSSLAYLRDLPLDQLKIDKAFISELRGGVEQPLVESMIAIARHMDLTVIAEGVENEVERDRLMDMGCRLFQGFYFSHPLPEPEFREWMGRYGTAVGERSVS